MDIRENIKKNPEWRKNDLGRITTGLLLSYETGLKLDKLSETQFSHL